MLAQNDTGGNALRPDAIPIHTLSSAASQGLPAEGAGALLRELFAPNFGAAVSTDEPLNAGASNRQIGRMPKQPLEQLARTGMNVRRCTVTVKSRLPQRTGPSAPIRSYQG